MNAQEFVLAVFSVVSSILIVCFAIALGWYLVWKLFLSRFKFVRELLGGFNDTNSAETDKTPIKPKKVRKE